MKRFIKHTLPKLAILTLVVTAALGTSYLYANWSAPSASPPADNVDAPLNTGNITQIKDAGLNLLSLIVNGPIQLISGSLQLDLSNSTEQKGHVLMSTDGSGTASWVATSSLGIVGSGGGGGSLEFSSIYTATAPRTGPDQVTTSIGSSGEWDSCYLTQASSYGSNADNEDEDFDCTVRDTGSEWQVVAEVISGEGVDAQCSAQCVRVTGSTGGGTGSGWCGASGRSTNGANISIDCMGNTLPAYSSNVSDPFYTDGGTQGSCPAGYTYMVVGADGNYIGTCVTDSGGGGTSLPSCADGEILVYDTGTSDWVCSAPAGGGGIGSVQRVTTNDPNNESCTATCPADTTLIGGGCDAVYESPLQKNTPVSGAEAWQCETSPNMSFGGYSGGLTCTALCAGTGGMLTMEDYLHVQDRKAAGTHGGDFFSGAWRTRDLNHTETNTISGASLSGNQFTLPQGTYYIEAQAPAKSVVAHKAKLRNVTDGTDELLGTTHHADRGDGDSQSESTVIGTFTVDSSSETFEIQHRGENSFNTNGYGRASGFGEPEIYTNVRIWKTN